jgi:hypothetical protein
MRETAKGNESKTCLIHEINFDKMGTNYSEGAIAIFWQYYAWKPRRKMFLLLRNECSIQPRAFLNTDGVYH